MALEVGGGLQAAVPLAVDPPLSCTVVMQDVHLGTRCLKVRHSVEDWIACKTFIVIV